jgi:hypothetical protein
VLDCVPPPDVLQFGGYEIPKDYRDALFEAHPHYTAEEVVGSYLGHGIFPSYDDWAESQRMQEEEDDENKDEDEDEDEGEGEGGGDNGN